MNREEISTLTQYNEAAPRYTSYPPANFFGPSVGQDEYSNFLELTNHTGIPELSFYFHIPFCPKRCLFCGCQTEIGVVKSAKERYFEALHRELDEVLPLLNPERPLTQIHFGGGTPNAVPIAWLGALLDRLRAHFPKHQGAEIAIECDPALFSRNTPQELWDVGFNRVSLGVQDFHQEVLNGVNRLVPKEGVAQAVDRLRAVGFKSINLDMIVGLPGQHPSHWTADIEELLRIKPERIAAFAYAHVPGFKSHQKQLESLYFAPPAEKLSMTMDLYEAMTAAGYVAVGMDHFALPHDELGKATLDGHLARNFQGYCVKERAGQVIAIGASGIAQWEMGYSQNIKDSKAYTEAILNGQSKVERFYALSAEQRRQRRLIEQVLCTGALNFQTLDPYGDFTPEQMQEFRTGLENALQKLSDENLILRKEYGFSLSPRGSWVRRVVAARLDPLLRSNEAQGKTFSSAI